MLSTKIKEATQSSHLLLEKVVVKKLKSIRSKADYADLLKCFYAYFGKIEKTIAPYITRELLPDYSERRNASYIKKDIEELGFTTDELPATHVPVIDSTAKALGALYVLEGSIMGGSIIVQMLAKSGITEGISFFSGYGEATGQMWGTFIAVLNAATSTEGDQDSAIQTANATFSQFADVFENLAVAG